MRCAIIRENIIFYIRIPENLRIFRNSFFTGKAAVEHGSRDAFWGSDPLPVKMKIGSIRRCSQFSYYQYNFR